MRLTLISRHYWITGDYKNFFHLDNRGWLNLANNYSGNNDFNFNIFNIDLVYEWRFSPDSI